MTDRALHSSIPPLSVFAHSDLQSCYRSQRRIKLELHTGASPRSLRIFKKTAPCLKLAGKRKIDVVHDFMGGKSSP